MNVHERIFVIAFCIGILCIGKGLCVGNCAFTRDNGTEISSIEWEFGLYLNSILDTTTTGTVLLNVAASDVVQINSISSSSESSLDFMRTTLNNDRFIITLTDDFAHYEEYETAETMKIIVSFACTTDTRNIEIYQPVVDTNNHYPEFQNAPYTYTLPRPLPANFPIHLFGTISARDADLTNTNISFTLDSSDPIIDALDVSWLSQDDVDVKLHYAKMMTTALLNIENSITFSLYATDMGEPPLTSEINVTINVDEENSIPITPRFANPVYIADHTDLKAGEASGTLITFFEGNITLNQGADSTVKYSLKDNIADYERNFEVTTSEDNSSFFLTLVDASDKLLLESFVVLTLTATKSGAADTSSTVLHISLPGLVCSSSSTPVIETTTSDSMTTDSGENESSTTTDGTDTSTDGSQGLSFPQSFYIFEKNATFTGILMTERATAVNADGTIVYSTVIDNQDLNDRILMDSETGELRITSIIKPGTYVFLIVATMEDWGLRTTATVMLTINRIITECDATQTFDYALQIIELEEESSHSNIVPLDNNGCDYVIDSQSPDQKWVFVSKNTLNTVSIDRESPHFYGMSVAQIHVVLEMICRDNDTSSLDYPSSLRTKRNTMHEILIENVPYVRTRMVVVIVITDINDNPPVWSANTPSAIGFPGHSLSQLIHTWHVYKFSATDADADNNAMITYLLNEGSTFYVRPVEGTMYAQHGIYIDDGEVVTVVATDGHWNATARVNIRTLESQNVAILYVEGAVLEDMDDVLEKLTSSTDHWIRSLGSAVVYASDEPRSSRLQAPAGMKKRVSDDDANTLLRIMIYGLTNDQNPLDSQDLIDLVGATEIQWNIVEKITLDALILNSTCDANIKDNFEDTTSLWATIIILIVLLVLIVVGLFTYTWYRRYKRGTSIGYYIVH